MLGVPCPELLKNHIWLPLILFKVLAVGCSVAHMSLPHVFKPYFEHLNHPIPKESQNGNTYYQFRPTCKIDEYMHAKLTQYHYLQYAMLFMLLVTYLRILTSGVPLAG